MIIDPNKGKKTVQCSHGREELLHDFKIRNPMLLGNSLKSVKSQIIGKGRNPRVGFTNGKFRYLHPAHCVFLSLCKSQCDVLVVAVNGDYSLRTLGDRDWETSRL